LVGKNVTQNFAYALSAAVVTMLLLAYALFLLIFVYYNSFFLSLTVKVSASSARILLQCLQRDSKVSAFKQEA
jgi:hypothetical protein